MIERLRAVEARTGRRRMGLLLAASTACISGFAVFLNTSAVRAVGDPVLFTTLKNAVAAAVLVALAAAFVARAPSRVDPIDRRSLAGLALIGVVGGSVPFVLFFTGLASASAPSAALIHKTLFVWVALLAVLLLRERLGRLQIGALGLLLVSQLLIQPTDGLRWTAGETMIALATGLWAVEVIVAKRLLARVPSPIAGASRMAIGLGVLVAYLAYSGGLGRVAALGAEQWLWVIGTGLLLSAYVATWYAALRRAPASAVTAVLTLGAPMTAGLQLVTAGQVPSPAGALGYAGTVAAASAIAWVALCSRPARPAAVRA